MYYLRTRMNLNSAGDFPVLLFWKISTIFRGSQWKAENGLRGWVCGQQQKKGSMSSWEWIFSLGHCCIPKGTHSESTSFRLWGPISRWQSMERVNLQTPTQYSIVNDKNFYCWFLLVPIGSIASEAKLGPILSTTFHLQSVLVYCIPLAQALRLRILISWKI